MRGLFLILFWGFFGFSVVAAQEEDQGEFIRVSHEPFYNQRNQLCYRIKYGYDFRDTINKWQPYCGKFENFIYRQGYEYTLWIEKFEPQSGVIRVVRIVSYNNYAAYKKELELIRKREEAKKNPKKKPVDDGSNYKNILYNKNRRK